MADRENIADAEIKWHWHRQAEDDLVRFAKEGGPKITSRAAHIVTTLGMFATENIEDIECCEQHGDIRLCWWPREHSLKAYFAETDRSLYVAHVANTETPYEFEMAKELALERIRAFLDSDEGILNE